MLSEFCVGGKEFNALGFPFFFNLKERSLVFRVKQGQLSEKRMVEFLAPEAALSILAQLMSRMLIIVRTKCMCWYVKQKTIYKIGNGLSVCFVFFLFF